ncbi:hypothetical protein [Streptomyces sp. NPDC091209]|uniref:hypothetical protein n=1 Tax=Streptomyces sp. NPDC091209 TaxID=3365974 RepID=UPI00381AE69E
MSTEQGHRASENPELLLGAEGERDRGGTFPGDLAECRLHRGRPGEDGGVVDQFTGRGCEVHVLHDSFGRHRVGRCGLPLVGVHGVEGTLHDLGDRTGDRPGVQGERAARPVARVLGERGVALDVAVHIDVVDVDPLAGLGVLPRQLHRVVGVFVQELPP